MADVAPRRTSLVVLAVTVLTVTAACGVLTPDAPPPAPRVTVSPDVARAKIAPPQPVPPVSFTVLAAGDLLPHGPVVRSADGGERFDRLLAGLDPWVAGADLALCHLEVPVAPDGTAPSGYPIFGAPPELVPALADQGWDGCSTASNHSVDRGYAGVVTTLDALDAAGMGHVGTARSHREQSRPQRYELERSGRSLVVAHLSATYGLNGLPMPSEAPWAVDLIDTGALVRAAVKARDRGGADVVVVSVHAGTEYTEVLTEQQVDVAAALAASGAVDLVIGHHAHVPQRIERLDGGPHGAGMWVAHGLGNLLSNQSASCCDARTSSGVLLTATITEERPSAPALVTDVRWTASTVDIPAGHRVQVLDGSPPRSTTLDRRERRVRHELVADAVGGKARERSEPPRPTGDQPTVLPRVPAGG
ncbi:CapA family protein [Isoptericola sediminis]|uniref:CapA family protein n=1 Tax=Isoptericola sediminis TaxID=2733572 RepID=UPI0031B5BB4E